MPKIGGFWDALAIIFVLVGLFLVLVYYKGTKAVGGTFFSGLNDTISNLQGRNAKSGSLTQYPS